MGHLLLLMSLALLGCNSDGLTLRVVPNANAESLSVQLFRDGLRTSAHVTDIYVYSFRCEDISASWKAPVWLVTHADSVGSVLLDSIGYGRTPMGMVNRMEPLRLTEGCYEFWLRMAHGRSFTRFAIDPNGVIHGFAQVTR
jgi:hypothetical protein